jgi:beta-glucanase (GH16 family)
MKITLLFLSLIIITSSKAQFTQPLDLNNYDLQQNESDEFDADTLILNPQPNSKWNDYVPWTPTGSIVWNKQSSTCVPRDQSSSPNPYCLNPNIVHGTEIINGQTLNFLRIDIKYDTVYRPAPGYQTWLGCSPDTNYLYFNYLYTSAILTSTQQYKYGYFEINARYPSDGIADGPAYWFCCGDGTYSEIDVFEKAFMCEPDNNDICISIHNGNLDKNCPQSSNYDYNNPCYSPIDNCGPNICDPISIPTNPRLNFHAYGLDWEPEYVKFYLDGNLIQEYTYEVLNINVPDCDYYGNSIPVDKLETQGLILTNALNNSSPTDQMPQPGQDYYYDIDYIRVYKIKPSVAYFSSVYTGGTFEFDAFQYRDLNKLIIDDNYVWSLQGGRIVNYLDSPVCSKAMIQIQDTTNLLITLTAKERSKNLTYFSPYRYSTSTTNINLIKQDMLIFPNPSESFFNIITPTKLLNDKSLELTVYNTLRERIQLITSIPTSGKIEFSLEGKSKGIYFVQLSNGSKAYMGKVIKE